MRRFSGPEEFIKTPEFCKIKKQYTKVCLYSIVLPVIMAFVTFVYSINLNVRSWVVTDCVRLNMCFERLL